MGSGGEKKKTARGGCTVAGGLRRGYGYEKSGDVSARMRSCAGGAYAPTKLGEVRGALRVNAGDNDTHITCHRNRLQAAKEERKKGNENKRA